MIGDYRVRKDISRDIILTLRPGVLIIRRGITIIVNSAWRRYLIGMRRSKRLMPQRIISTGSANGVLKILRIY